MKRSKNIIAVLVYALISVLVATFVGAHPPADIQLGPLGEAAVGVVSFTLLAGSRLGLWGVGYTGVIVAGIDQEIWIDRLVEQTIPDNSFLNTVNKLDDEYILAGAVVHKPNAGANPAGQKNRTVFPGVAVRRTDTDTTYPLDVYTTDPTHIPNAELMQINYRKVDSVLRAHSATLKTMIALDALYAYAGVGASQLLRTTGALVGTNLSASATGTRRKIAFDDFVRAQAVLDAQDIESENRFVLLDAGTYAELITDTDVKGAQIQLLADLKKGIVGELMGFKIMKRSTNTIYDNTGTPVKRAVGASGAATDNKSALFYHGPSLDWSLGSVRFYENLQDALYYGDVYSAEMKAGGRQGRGDGKGVLSLVQAAS